MALHLLVETIHTQRLFLEFFPTQSVCGESQMESVIELAIARP
jgi:hypothetical protein